MYLSLPLHVAPVNPGGHVHVNSSPWLLQVPPLHGTAEQGSKTVTERYQLLNIQGQRNDVLVLIRKKYGFCHLEKLKCYLFVLCTSVGCPCMSLHV